MDTTNFKRLIAFCLAVLTFILVLSVFYVGLAQIPSGLTGLPEFSLPIMILIGAVVLLFSLVFAAAGFAALDLSDRARALSLPEGSVRALIALLLITTFAIMAIFLYMRVRYPLSTTKFESTGLTLEDKDALVSAISSEELLSVSGEITRTATMTEEVRLYTVTRGVKYDEASKDFALQILTTIATLVVAVAGFYFGTRAVETAREAVGRPKVIVPHVKDLLAEDAEDKIKGKGLIPYCKDVVNLEGEDGKVFDHSPEAEAEVEKGSTVTLFVTKKPEVTEESPPPVTVPPLKDLPEEEARSKVEEKGLVAQVEYKETADADPGIVLDQAPEADTEVEKGSTVTLFVAKEPEVTEGLPTVPPLKDLTEEEARSKVEEKGLVAQVEYKETADVDPGIVLDQAPEADTEVEKGSTVTLTVAKKNVRG